MKSTPWKRTAVHILAITIFTIAVMSVPLSQGITDGNDARQHYQFAISLNEAIDRGNYFPGWSALVNHGFGDVGIRFYPPLSYFILIGFETICGDWLTGSNLAFSFWFFLGGLGVYLWARHWLSGNASLFAALIYTAAPYHTNEIFNAFTYAEFAAAGVLPYCFLFAARIGKGGGTNNIVGLAIAYACLILTHIPMSVMGSIALLLYSPATIWDQRHPSTSWRNDILPRLARLTAGALLGLLASAFYWIKVVCELNAVNHSTAEFSSNEYDYRLNFVLSYFSVSEKTYFERSLGHCDTLLVITLLFGIPGLIVYVFRKCSRQTKSYIAPVILFTFAIFMSTPASTLIWEHCGLLQKIQFPWRWLAITSIAASFIAAIGYDSLEGSARNTLRVARMIFLGFTLAGLVLTVTQVIMPAAIYSRAQFDRRLAGLQSAESYTCWWPVGANPNAFENLQPVSTENRSVSVSTWDSELREFNVGEGSPQNVRIATFYYPHWKAYVNGSKIQVSKDESGAILIPVSADSSGVKLIFEEPLYSVTAKYISTVTWAGFCLILLFHFSRRRPVLPIIT